ncbi:MAG TPA: glycosyltransferase family 4 protein [bacterium]|nr:glycosyltransferase family 4 protein [bacterium]
MKILILTQKIDKNDSNLGFFHRWVEEFSKNCQFVTVICLYLGEVSLPDNVRVISLGKEEGFSRFKYLVNFFKYIWKYRKDYDNVFVHMNQIYIILGGFIWKALNKRVGLWYAHGGVSNSLRLAEKMTDIVFTSTPSGFRLKSKKVKVVGQGIDVKIFKPFLDARNDNFFRVTTVGRISPVKNYETLILAIYRLRDKIENLYVNIVGGPCGDGDDVYFEKIRKMVTELGLNHIINFVGSVNNEKVFDFLKNSDIFINTSHTGSLDKAILESMACGVPILTCNEAILSLGLKDQNNFIFRKKDDIDLSEKIYNYYFFDIDKRNNLKEYLSDFVVNNYSLNLLIDKILREYIKKIN